MDEINLDYADIIKAYQSKVTELLNQVITAEAKFNASAGYIAKLKTRIQELEAENKKLSSLKTTKSSKNTEQKSETVIDYN